ncbi:MAG: cobalamin-dependent protein [Pseudomonadota bacterium]|nr:cobalamin-dependent protein [Pseudomonadota bacterium]
MIGIHQQVSEAIGSRRSELATLVVERHFTRHPQLEQRYGKAGRNHCQQDAGYHLAYLAQAIAADCAALFGDYVGWAKIMLAKRGVPAGDLASLLETMKESLEQALPAEFGPLAGGFLDAALQQLPHLPDDIPSFIRQGTPLAALATQYLRALLQGERHNASKLILAAVEQGTPVRDLYRNVFEASQHEIGRLWQINQISVAQEHYCTAAAQLIISQLYPNIFGAKKGLGTLVATGVSGDLHELGARMVCDFFEMDGWHTHYLGANVPAADVIQTIVQVKAGVVAISATIAYHVHAVTELIAAVRRTPACCNVTILVGGYPFKVAPELWRIVGADGSANDAESAVTLANRLTRQSGPT